MSIFEATVPMFIKGLTALDNCLVKATAHADAKKFDIDWLLTTKLAPDQFSLARQVQSACDTAKWAAAKLAGKDGPSHPDTEKTMAELRARIATCVAYLKTFKPEDFAGAEERKCQHGWMGTAWMKGSDYAQHYAIANFYFHVSHAYALLRHNGVELGKFDYLGGLPFGS